MRQIVYVAPAWRYTNYDGRRFRFRPDEWGRYTVQIERSDKRRWRTVKTEETKSAVLAKAAAKSLRQARKNPTE